MSTIAVIGATGTAGSLVTKKLKSRDVTTVEISRSHGVDLISGQGLSEALQGVDVAIDTSNVVPDDKADIVAAYSTAARNLVAACVAGEVRRLVVLTIAGIDRPEFDDVASCVAKRRQREIVLHSGANHHRQVDSLARVRGQPSGGDLQPDRSHRSRLAYSAHRSRHRGGGPPGSRIGCAVWPAHHHRAGGDPLPNLTAKMLDAQGDHRRVRRAAAIGRTSRRYPAGTTPRRGDRSDHRHLAGNHQRPGTALPFPIT